MTGSNTPGAVVDVLLADKAKLAADRQALDKDQADFAEQSKKHDEREKVIAQKEAAIRRQGHRDFCDGLVKDGRMLPVFVPGLVEFMATVDETGVIEFGEGDKKEKTDVGAWLRKYLQSQPKLVTFGETAPGGAPASTDQTPEMIAKKAVEFQESELRAGREISATEAVQHIIKGGSK